MLKNEWDAATQDFDQAIKLSLAVQPIHWLSRLRKGDCLYHARRCEEGAKELRFFMQKSFSESDPNHRYRAKAEYLLGECEKLAKA